ncbi:hypothetical protein EG68_06660 [Paragonimus skrjabini miyazakii]|uniref:Uncharacterized protein n=1 Tax=Paragonimus skrjabini miyazakii TaxID=59628 RepID=A0A8S9YNH3_9TREM|nr:hypothetical protein EG68_06660 [Paragonimus skrjabini miyazakii]
MIFGCTVPLVNWIVFYFPDPKRSSSNSSCKKKPQPKPSKLNDGYSSKESSSGPSVSFPIKRSALSTKHLDTPVTFRSTDTEHESEDSYPESKPVVTTACSHQSPFSAKPPNVGESQTSSVETSQLLSAHEGEFPHRLESSPLDCVTKRDSEASIPHKSSEKLRLKSRCHHGSLHEDSSRGRRVGCSINHESIDSTGLVTYNNTDDEQAQRDTLALSSHSSKKRRNTKRLKDVNELNLNVTPVVPTQVATSTDGVSKVSKSQLSNEIKVVKTTAKSSWDSSDSDFEASTVDRTQVHVLSEKSLGIDESQSTKQYTSKEVDVAKRSSAKRKSGSVALSYHKGSAEMVSNRDEIRAPSDVHRRPQRSKVKRSHRAHKRSHSSCSSSGRVHSDNGEVDLKRARRTTEKRTHSQETESSRSSKNDSEYSTASSRSSDRHGHHRHHSPRRKRSKSYTSHSSSRESSNISRGYRDRTKSSSRSDRHRRRRIRSSYRHRYRRRSYSSRSRSRSSWRTSDSSSRSSYRSSHSSASRASSTLSRHRSSTTRRSSSRQSDELHRKVSSSSKLTKVDQPASPPESRLARLGVGPVRQNGASDSRTNNLKTAFSLSNVAETVSAAVKRVTGGNAASTRYTLSSENGTSETHSETTLRPSDKVDASVPASGLVDIPLPKDATQSSLYSRGLEELPTRNEPAPYIGPQLPPDLARRFGLSISEATPFPNPVHTELSTSASTVPSDARPTQHDSDAVPTNSSQANAPEFFIPPEKVEQYRALQEQAMQHARRRNIQLVSGSSTEVYSSGHFSQLDAHTQQQQQQLALLQQLVGRDPSFLIAPTSSGFIQHPAYSTNLLANWAPQTVSAHSTAECSGPTESWAAQISEEARLRSLSTLLGVQQQINAQQQLFTALSNQTMGARALSGSEPIASSATVSKASALELSPLSTILPASLHQLQPAQLQQMLAAASAVQAVQSGTGSVSLQPQQQTQAAIVSQLLHQLAAQQAQKIPAVSALTASAFAAHLQQQQYQKLQALQKSAVDSIQKASAEDRLASLAMLSDAATSFSGVTPIGSVGTSNQANAALSVGLLRARGVNSISPLVALPAANMNVHSQASMTALLAAAQQQQWLASAMRQQPGSLVSGALPDINLNTTPLRMHFSVCDQQSKELMRRKHDLPLKLVTLPVFGTGLLNH